MISPDSLADDDFAEEGASKRRWLFKGAAEKKPRSEKDEEAGSSVMDMIDDMLHVASPQRPVVAAAGQTTTTTSQQVRIRHVASKRALMLVNGKLVADPTALLSGTVFTLEVVSASSSSYCRLVHDGGVLTYGNVALTSFRRISASGQGPNVYYLRVVTPTKDAGYFSSNPTSTGGGVSSGRKKAQGWERFRFEEVTGAA